MYDIIMDNGKILLFQTQKAETKGEVRLSNEDSYGLLPTRWRKRFQRDKNQ